MGERIQHTDDTSRNMGDINHAQNLKRFRRRLVPAVVGTAGVATALLAGCTFSHPERSSAINTITPARTPITDTAPAIQQAIPNSVAEPSATPSPLPTKIETEQKEKKHDFMLGNISLKKPFSIIVPAGLARRALIGLKEITTLMDPHPVLGKETPSDLLKAFYDYYKQPNLAAVYVSDVPGHTLVFAHDGTDTLGRTWPFEWIQRLYKRNPELLIGEKVLISQELENGKTEIAELEIISAIKIPANELSEWGTWDYDPESGRPMFFKLDELGLSEDAKQADELTFVSCTGNRVASPEGYEYRILVTGKISSSWTQ